MAVFIVRQSRLLRLVEAGCERKAAEVVCVKLLLVDLLEVFRMDAEELREGSLSRQGELT